MTLDEILSALFPAGHAIARGPHGTLNGTARLEGTGEVAVIGVADGTPLGIDGALALAAHVQTVVEKGAAVPILV